MKNPNPYYEQTNQFCFHFIFTYKKEASFFTRFEELLKVAVFGQTCYNRCRMCGPVV